MIFIVVKFTAKPEHADQWLSRVDEFTQATRAEAGNLFFEWSRSVEEPNTFVLVEAFADGDAGTAHVQSDHFKAGIETLSSMVASTPKIVNVEAPGDGWSVMAEVSPTG